jgi:hypothetical protein
VVTEAQDPLPHKSLNVESLGAYPMSGSMLLTNAVLSTPATKAEIVIRT